MNLKIVQLFYSLIGRADGEFVVFSGPFDAILEYSANCSFVICHIDHAESLLTQIQQMNKEIRLSRNK